MEIILEGFAGALGNFSTLELWVAIAIGVLIGVVFGIVPGISGLIACTLILPFVFKMKPEQALPLMVVVLGVQYQGGAITSILLNLPGTAGSAATLLDGFPMTLKGEAGRAIGAAQVASALASIISALGAVALSLLILPIVLGLRTGDMVFIVLLGISFIAVLGSGSMLKGLLSGTIGLLISFIGWQPVTSVARFTFGSLYLYDGIPIVPVALGLFSMPEMIALATRGGTLARTRVAIKGMRDVWRGVKDVFHHWGLVLRSNLIGFILGIVPALGPASAAFIAYGQAKQTSKYPEAFGTGNVEGVIAPESANNACVAGDLLTTLAIGVPGSGAMALLLGAVTILGLVPGPEMLTKHLDLSLTIMWVIAIGGLIGLALLLPLAPRLSAIAFVPGRVLVPLVLVIALVGAFAYRREVGDVIAVFVFSMVGLVMRRFGFNRPALFLAYILGFFFEKYLFMALRLTGPLFFLRPVSLILIAAIIGVIAYGPIKGLFQQRRGAKKV